MAVEAKEGLRFEPERLVIVKGDHKKSLRKRRAEYTSHAYFAVLVPITEGQRSFEKVKEVRTLIEGLGFEGENTKLYDGAVSLVLKRPDQYRTELMNAIFSDIDAMKAGFGDEFEILPNGLNSAVKSRPFSDTEVEVWIDYSFAIRSIRDLVRNQSK